MKKITLIVLLLSFLNGFAQTEAQILNEAQNRNITTQQEALEALSVQGISENQARQLARMCGIDFDTFLR